MLKQFSRQAQRFRLLPQDLRARRHFRAHAPVFIVGAPRSGTTLLLQVLSAQPRVTQSFEPRTVWNLVFGEGRDDSYTDRLSSWQLVKLRTLYFTALEPDRPVLVSKDPCDSLRLPLLASMFPTARFVHIVRDPRDVVSSISKIWTTSNQYRTDPACDWVHVRIPGYRELAPKPPHIKASLMWRCCVDRVEEAFGDIPRKRCLTVRYEDIVRAPYPTIAELLGKAIGEYDARSLEGVVQYVSDEVKPTAATASPEPAPGKGFERRWVKSAVPLDAGSGTMSSSVRIGKWRDSLTDEQLTQCMEIVGDGLRRHGYPADVAQAEKTSAATAMC